ncbi:MAG TPA: ABC transporter substrate-binding protein [Candidatus Dormibacteraeota bacterium]|jgi:ABC-type nitrate/sulfonate/bicarbonate transport system substrate-binding protein|nr:ABC transporter substrate-binding protein [Candidatus Dormibacteraeota bacterium]
MKFTTLRFLGLVTVLVVIATACGSSPSPGGTAAVQKVSLRLKWLHQAQFAGFYAADKEGYYNSANLAATLEPGGPNADAVQLVAGGSDTFGEAGADQVLLARAKGVDIVAVAVIYQQTPFALITKASSGIQTMAQLKGKKIGVKFGQSEEVTYRAMLAAGGLTQSQVTESPVQFDMGPFLAGSIDAFPGYSINEALAAQEQGTPVNLITPTSVGITNFYADTVFTTGAEIKNHPDVVKAFVQASLKGWDWAYANPDAAAALGLNWDSTLKLPHEKAEMAASLPSLKPGTMPIGSMDTASWTALQNLLLSQKQLSSAQDISKAMTTTFLPSS